MKEFDANLNNSINTISNQMAAEMTGINDNITAMEGAINEKFESVAGNFSLYHPPEANTTSKCFLEDILQLIVISYIEPNITVIKVRLIYTF